MTRSKIKENNAASALALILCFTIPMIDHLLKPNPQTISSFFPFLLITRNIYYLIGPLLWLYARSLVKKNPISWKWILIHFIPFVTWINLSYQFKEHLMVIVPRMNPVEPSSILPLLRSTGSFFSAIIYGVYVLYLLWNHSKDVQNFYSNKNIRNTLSWLKVLLIIMIGIYSLFLLSEVFKFSFRIPFIINSAQILSMTPIIFIFFFSYFSKDQQIPEDTKSEFKLEKYKKSSLEESAIEKIYIDLLKLLKTKNISKTAAYNR